ncbi:MAG: alpha-glucan family phosphorylase [Nitrososphaerales archaeon]
MKIAVFVMEVGIDDQIPTYSGGLGVLAGDLAFSFSDFGLPATFITLLSRNGYASQRLDRERGQLDAPHPWDYARILSPTDARANVEVGGTVQRVGVWEYKIRGKAETSVLFLDTDFPENDKKVRDATERLYEGEIWQRMLQDIILGIGGYRILKALGRNVDVYHLNESHAAFATIELLRDAGSPEAARRRCAFTTHTPIAAGNDVFPLAMVEEALSKYPWVDWTKESVDGSINLSRLAAKYSGVTNAVSLKHKYVAGSVLGFDNISYVTNGVYHKRWVHDELKRVYDRHLPGWQDSPSLLVRALGIPSVELAEARKAVKRTLVTMVNERTGLHFDEGALTISVAKRITSYKRNNMILSDPERLERIAGEKGGIQVIIAGKAHPRDDVAKSMLADAIHEADQLNRGSQKVKIAILENYGIEMAKLLVAGSDVWLNNPRRPLEACGTSGIKAAINGVLNFSVYDGWWLEGGIEGVNGWGIGRRLEWNDLSASIDGEDAGDMFRKLTDEIVPTYYNDRARWWNMSRMSIATVGPLFNSYRMVGDYVTKVYSLLRRDS